MKIIDRTECMSKELKAVHRSVVKYWWKPRDHFLLWKRIKEARFQLCCTNTSAAVKQTPAEHNDFHSSLSTTQNSHLMVPKK